MEKKGIKAFEKALKADEALRQRFEEAFRNVTEASCDGEAMQKAAAELGYEISLEELEQTWAGMQEMDEDELGEVAAGQVTYDGWCWTIWCCYTISKHPDDIPDKVKCPVTTTTNNHDEACWKNYTCLLWSHEHPDLEAGNQ